MNYGSLSNGESGWVVIVNHGATGNSAEFAETVFRRNTQINELGTGAPPRF
jgi:hypothetical protein